MDPEPDSVARLRHAGLRLTPQRRLVVTALQRAPGHVSASELFAEAQRAYPAIDISTVYRILATLKDHGLVTETDIGSNERAYEWATGRRHHHLVCHTCRAVQQIDHPIFAGVTDQLRHERGFEADLNHVAIFGQCGECATMRGSNGDTEEEPG